MPKKILFVCTGNTCRSAMAAAIMNDIAVKDDLDVLIDSAGLWAVPGNAASENAVEALSEMGIDLSCHRSKPLSNDLIEQADIILVMTSEHKSMLIPYASDKTYTLLEYADMEGDVSDPYGGDIYTYERTAQQIYEALKKIEEKL